MVNIDDSRWPLVHLSVQGRAEAEDAERLSVRFGRWLRRGERFAIVLDSNESGLPSPRFVRGIRAMRDQHERGMRELVVGFSVVAGSPVSRGVFRLLFVIEEPPYPSKAWPDVAAAEAWAEERLAESAQEALAS